MRIPNWLGWTLWILTLPLLVVTGLLIVIFEDKYV